MINKVSFGGIYSVNFPKSYSKEQVEAQAEKLNAFVKAYKLNKVVKVECVSDDRIIGVNTCIEHPQLHYELFNAISPKLARDYVAKTQVNLYA